MLCHASVVRKNITPSGPCVSYRFVEVHSVASAANAPEMVIMGDHFHLCTVTKDSNSMFATNARWAVAFICYGYGIKERNVNRGKMKDPLPRFNCVDHKHEAHGPISFLESP